MPTNPAADPTPEKELQRLVNKFGDLLVAFGDTTDGTTTLLNQLSRYVETDVSTSKNVARTHETAMDSLWFLFDTLTELYRRNQRNLAHLQQIV
jgi:hypothetical protein